MNQLQISAIAADRFATIIKNNPSLEGVACPMAIYKSQKEFKAITGERVTIDDHRQIIMMVAGMLANIGAKPVLVEVREKPFFTWLNNKGYDNNNAARSLYVAEKHSGKSGDAVLAQVDGAPEYDFVAQIKDAISRKIVSIPEVAKQAGIANQTLYRYLNGEGNMTVDNLQKILKVLEI